MEDFNIIKQYIEDRIRIDSLQNGFNKAYQETLLKHKNSEILSALSRCEFIINNLSKNA